MAVTTKDNTPQMLQAMRELARTRVYVGIPASAKPRPPEDGITNAEIGYVQEHGQPETNLPARPFLVPGVMAVHQQTIAFFQQAQNAALDGNLAQARRFMNRAGLNAAASVQNHIPTAGWAPLSQRTIDERLEKHPFVYTRDPVTNKRTRRQALASDVTPLVDTGALRQSITYVSRRE